MVEDGGPVLGEESDDSLPERRTSLIVAKIMHEKDPRQDPAGYRAFFSKAVGDALEALASELLRARWLSVVRSGRKYSPG